MLTGDVPTEEQVKSLSEELGCRACIPCHVINFLDNVPTTVHPMCQLACAISLLNHDSQFVKAYNCGVKRQDYWETTYEDAMTLIATIPLIAARIYTRTYHNCCSTLPVDPCTDWSTNFCRLIGFDSKEFIECMRLYFTIHSDHEGGNVSAHTSHLVGSALSDPFISYASGLHGLAGPLHGLANQEVLKWIFKLKEEVGGTPTHDNITKFVHQTLKTTVVPGFGHAVLRRTDPRYLCQRAFAKKHLPDDPIFQIVKMLYKIVPPILIGLEKVKNPFPNVDAHSGVLLYHYGLKEMEFYTVVFGISRCLGVMAQHIWSRALMLPIERPKSITTKQLMKRMKYKP